MRFWKVSCNSDFFHDFRLQQWVRRKNIDAPSEADAGPTASIMCRHGQLRPEQAGAKRLLVPETLWHFLYKDAVAVKSDDPLGCTTFPSDSAQCSECSDELSEVACFEDSIRLFTCLINSTDQSNLSFLELCHAAGR